MRKKHKRYLAKFIDKSVSFYAFGVAIVLVIYMLSNFFVGTWNFFAQFGTILETVSGGDIVGKHNPDRQIIETNILHFIAFTIVLIKAYRILICYAKTQHINIKYLVEIAIIAPAIEILFNSHAYDLSILILFAFFGVANLIIYVWKFDQFKKIEKDTHHPDA